jgi:autotransporter-associated beta strand protein
MRGNISWQAVLVLSVGAAMFALSAGEARAATLTWDTAPGTVGAGDGSITGGNGTWNTTNGNWTSDGGGANVAWVNGNNDTAVFGGAAGTVTLGEGITVGGLRFDTAGYTVTGNTLTFGAAGSIAANVDATIGSLLAGGVAISKTGAGKLTLTAANTYTGLTTVSGGVLELQHAAFSNTARAYNINSDAVLNVVFDSDYDNVPVGTTTFNGTGTLRITGDLWCEGGSRFITMSLGSGGLIDVPTGSELWNGGWWTITWTSNLADLNVDGRFNIWDGHNVFVDALTGTGTVVRGHIKGGPDSPVTALTVGVDNGSGTFSGAIVISQYKLPLDVVKTGSGTQTLTGANTYTGATTVNAGTLVLAGAGSINTTTGITVNGPTAVFMQNSSVANDRTFTLTRGTLGGTGTISTAITSGIDVTIAPGDRTLSVPAKGVLTIANAVDLTDGTTEIRLFSTAANDSDQLVQITTGGLTYGGILKVTAVNSLAFAIGNHWDLFDFESQSGTFSNNSEFGTVGDINLPLLAAGQKWSFDYGTGVLSVVLGAIPGDTNNDGVVDAADYLAVKQNLGLTTGATLGQGNVDGDDDVDWDDLQVVMTNFGTGASTTPAMTPEPCSAMLLVLGAMAVVRRRARIGRISR